MTTTNFTVYGPIKIHRDRGRAGGSYITRNSGEKVWAEHPDISGRYGCYVFGVRNGKSGKPAYIGKTIRPFSARVFSDDNLRRYNEYLLKVGKGTPILFLLMAPEKKGKRNQRHVSKLERFLIQTASAVNPRLINVQGKKTEGWSITGVLGGGWPNAAAKTFRGLLKLV